MGQLTSKAQQVFLSIRRPHQTSCCQESRLKEKREEGILVSRTSRKENFKNSQYYLMLL